MNYNPDELAEYIIINKCTVRECAKHFGISKSYVHILIHKCSEELKEDLERTLNYNLSQIAIRGGNSTKKYWKMKKGVNNEQNKRLDRK